MSIFNKKKTIFLDIDGVFNALSKLEEDREIVPHPWGNWQISKANLDFLKYLSENCECIWISSWSDESNEINNFIGIKPFKYIYDGDKQKCLDKYYKSRNAKNYLVIDDEYIDSKCMSIKTNQETGLIEEDRNKIMNWIEGGDVNMRKKNKLSKNSIFTHN